MNKIVELLNQLITKVFDITLAPLNVLPPIWGLVFISLVSGVILIYLYGLVSNQAAIKKIKTKIHASILEAIIFRNDIKLSLAAQGKMLGYAFQYFARAIPPLIILAIPCIFILAQLNLRYGFRPLMQGESTLLKVQLNDPGALYNVALENNPEITSTPPLRISDHAEIVWRLKLEEGTKPVPLSFKGLNGDLNSNVIVGPALKIPSYSSTTPWMNVLYPDGAKLPDNVKEFSIAYPERSYLLFGLHMHWIVIFFILSLVSGLFAAKVFKIEI